jgi:hypothetical protein
VTFFSVISKYSAQIEVAIIEQTETKEMQKWLHALLSLRLGSSALSNSILSIFEVVIRLYGEKEISDES